MRFTNLSTAHAEGNHDVIEASLGIEEASIRCCDRALASCIVQAREGSYSGLQSCRTYAKEVSDLL
jgi:hypothetical protein